MRKLKKFIIILVFAILILIVPNVSKANVEVEREITSNNGTIKFTFTGLTLDITKEYEYGFSITQAAPVKDWYVITEYTESSAITNMNVMTDEMREIFNATDNGYITIREKNTDTIILDHHKVDFKLGFFDITNCMVLNNGKEFDLFGNNGIMVTIIQIL